GSKTSTTRSIGSVEKRTPVSRRANKRVRQSAAGVVTHDHPLGQRLIGAGNVLPEAEQTQHRAELVAHLEPADDAIDHAVLEQELAALKALGQLLTDGLLDHPRPREADQRARLGDDQITEEREAGRDATGGRV